MKPIYTIITLSVILLGCNNPEQKDEQFKEVTIRNFKNRYRHPLDSNYFKFFETGNQRDELVIYNPQGNKEASYTYDKYGLVYVRNYTENKLKRERYYEKNDSSIRVIDTHFFPTGWYTNGYSVNSLTGETKNNLESDLFYVLNPIDTLQQGANYSIIIDTKNIKSKRITTESIKKIVYDLNDNFAYTSKDDIKIRKIPIDTFHYVLETNNPGINYKRLVLYLLEKDTKTQKINDTVQSFSFEYKYFVKPNQEIGPFLGNFQNVFKEKINNDR